MPDPNLYEEPNRIFSTGVTPDGMRAAGKHYPSLTVDDVVRRIGNPLEEDGDV